MMPPQSCVPATSEGSAAGTQLTAEQLEDRRDSMSLADRIRARRDLDIAAGEVYTPPQLPETDLIRLIDVLISA